jgi:hypothetical protein
VRDFARCDAEFRVDDENWKKGRDISSGLANPVGMPPPWRS